MPYTSTSMPTSTAAVPEGARSPTIRLAGCQARARDLQHFLYFTPDPHRQWIGKPAAFGGFDKIVGECERIVGVERRGSQSVQIICGKRARGEHAREPIADDRTHLVDANHKTRSRP